MAKYKENPRYHVVSVRISSEDRQALEQLSRDCNKKVAELMREALLMLNPAARLQFP